MRYVITLTLVVGFLNGWSQTVTAKSGLLVKPPANIEIVSTISGKEIPSTSVAVVPKDNNATKSTGIRCLGSKMPDPLIVIDGYIAEDGLEQIDPDMVESITILKEAAATCIWGCRGSNGVIIITTKTFRKKIVVKDGVTGTELSDATISYTCQRRPITITTDKQGVAILDKFRIKQEYPITVSSKGYQDVNTVIVNNKHDQIIFLTKDSHTADVIADSSCLSVYPNPVQRGQRFTINVPAKASNQSILKIAGINGQQQFSNSLTGNKSVVTVPISTSWAPGVYIIRLTDESTHTIQSAKLIIQ
jgi:TonB-dependent SusC/RagA subfamily outer membrane receptor